MSVLRASQNSAVMSAKKIINFAGCFGVVAALSFGLMTASGAAYAAGGEWVEGYKVRSRLIAGSVARGKTQESLAFVQIEMAPGWKTYWRHPGEAGGIPPQFTWTGSKNLRNVEVLYPAPKRLTDPIGDTVGYTDGVIFPVRIVAKQPDQPVDLNLFLRFGICKDICVPSEAKMRIELPVSAEISLPSEMSQALQQVPRSQSQRQPSDPMLQAVKAPRRIGEHWIVDFTTKHSAAVAGADLFLEAPEGIFVPLPNRTTGAPDTLASFQIKLSDDEYKALQGKTLRATVVDHHGASEADFVLR